MNKIKIFNIFIAILIITSLIAGISSGKILESWDYEENYNTTLQDLTGNNTNTLNYDIRKDKNMSADTNMKLRMNISYDPLNTDENFAHHLRLINSDGDILLYINIDDDSSVDSSDPNGDKIRLNYKYQNGTVETIKEWKGNPDSLSATDYAYYFEYNANNNTWRMRFERQDGTTIDDLDTGYFSRSENYTIADVEKLEHFVSSSVGGTTNGLTFEPANSKIRASDSNGGSIHYDEYKIDTSEPVNIELDIQKYMEHGTTQKYKVTDTETNSDVTNNATVVSSNTTVVSINDSTNQLIATSNENISDIVEITATYEGQSVSKNVTVATRTIDNIGIMPPSLFVPAFFGIDDDTAKWGIGSDIQWLFLVMLIGSLIGGVSKNSWLSIGVIIFLQIITWILGYTDLGTLLATLFFGIALGISLLDVPRKQSISIENE